MHGFNQFKPWVNLVRTMLVFMCQQKKMYILNILSSKRDGSNHGLNRFEPRFKPVWTMFRQWKKKHILNILSSKCDGSNHGLNRFKPRFKPVGTIGGLNRVGTMMV